MDGSLINIKNVSLVTMLAAGAAAVYLLNTPHKIKGKHQIALKSEDDEAIGKMMEELHKKREEILRKFEESNHECIPIEMIDTINYIYKQDPNRHTQSIRLLCSQLIQDYAVMYTNVKRMEPQNDVIKLAKSWLDFLPMDSSICMEQINHRYALALKSRSMKEFRQLYEWLNDVDTSFREQKSIHDNWILRKFQCACLLGKWAEVLESGRELEKMDPTMLESPSSSNQSSIPLHPLHLFDYIALRIPKQSANFAQVYFNVERYINLFDPRLTPPLKFTEWKMLDCTTCLKFGFSTDQKRDEELKEQIAKAQVNEVVDPSLLLFVYGCLVQYPCSWVQVPTAKNQLQPAVLCGPWNDTEMELTASYIRRHSSNAEREDEKQDRDRIIQVVRSDLRLHLDRSVPSLKGSLQDIHSNNDNTNENSGEKNLIGNSLDNYNEMMEPSAESMSAAVGWIWRGTFDHEEGLLEIKEKDISSFEFRRDSSWKEKSLKCTCRTWDIQMIIATPD